MQASWVETYLGAIAEERRFLVVLFNRLGVKIYSSGPLMLSKGLVSLRLERSSGLNVRSHSNSGGFLEGRGVEEGFLVSRHETNRGQEGVPKKRRRQDLE